MQENKKINISETKHDDPILNVKPMDNVTLPIPAKILAILCIVQCVVSAPIAYTYIIDFINGISNGSFSSKSASFIILYSVFLAGMAALICLLIGIGVTLLLNKRRNAAILTNLGAITTIIAVASDVMITGITPVTYILVLSIILMFVLKSYIDPSLSQERKLQKKLRNLEYKKEAEEGSLGFSKKEEGRPKLNYFNLFWLFFIMCIVGYVLEIIWHMTVDDPGVYQERAGFLFGPFSPIYGFGAVIISICLNKFTNKNFIIVFIIGALLGGFFEYFASLYLETCFGVRSWDYSHLPFNIEGRTSLRFFIIWGFIAVIWVKVLVKPTIKLINKIPWKLRYSITIAASIFMLINMVMTFEALDCWYTRSAGNVPDAPIEEFYAKNFDDDFMKKRFENMKMNPQNSARGANPEQNNQSSN